MAILGVNGKNFAIGTTPEEDLNLMATMVASIHEMGMKTIIKEFVSQGRHMTSKNLDILQKRDPTLGLEFRAEDTYLDKERATMRNFGPHKAKKRLPVLVALCGKRGVSLPEVINRELPTSLRGSEPVAASDGRVSDLEAKVAALAAENATLVSLIENLVDRIDKLEVLKPLVRKGNFNRVQLNSSQEGPTDDRDREDEGHGGDVGGDRRRHEATPGPDDGRLEEEDAGRDPAREAMPHPRGGQDDGEVRGRPQDRVAAEQACDPALMSRARLERIIAERRRLN